VNKPGLDSDIPTLHIRCGSDIRDKLLAAGFTGEFLEYSDPVCEGPVPDSPDLIEIRARYLAAGAGRFMGFTEAECADRLRAAEQRLTAARRYGRVVLWFEHDSYDQLVLARCLANFGSGLRPNSLELICIDRHLDFPRFIGLGQLEPTALAALWPGRMAVTPAQVALGQAIWAALRMPDPTGLQDIAATGTPALPIAAPALRRHLQELPWTADGLSLTQRLVLTILDEGPTRIGRIFAAMVQGREPLLFMGDLGLLLTVEAMARTDPAVLTIEPGDKPFPRVASITESGRRVLAGKIGYLSLSPPERWVGGVVADGRWLWDEVGSSVQQRQG
jgi:hypothetical protein